MKGDDRTYFFKEADYKKQEIPEYRGVPLIEALPHIMSVEKALKELPIRPEFNESEREADDAIRIHLLARVRNFFEALPHHFELQERISSLIRDGYVNRNPCSSAYVRQLNDGYERVRIRDLNYANNSLPSTAECIVLVGDSGTGKTTAIIRILAFYDQVLCHSKFGLLQIVWLKIDCPSSGSIRQLCSNFFLAVDSLLKTNYHAEYVSRGKHLDEMLAHMGMIANIHCIGLLVIDEFQNLMVCNSKEAESMFNFINSLTNTVNIPVALIGTPKCLPLIQANLRQSRRANAGGSFRFHRFLPHDKNWKKLIQNLWKYQWVKDPGPLTDEIKDALYDESQGILALLTTLFRLAQHRAIATKKERLTASRIRLIAKEKMPDVQEIITALRSNDEDALLRYDDILPKALQPTAFPSDQMKNLSTGPLIPPELELACHNLLEKGYDFSEILDAVKEVALHNPNFDSLDLSYAANNILQERYQFKEFNSDKKCRPKKIDPQDLEADDLRLAYFEAEDEGIDIYQILNDTGIIKSPVGEFVIN